MLHGRGGEMRFKYVPKLKRSIPYIVDAEEWVTENNYDEIAEWVKKNGFPVVESAPRYFITVEIPASDFDDTTRELYNKKILFDWETNG
jgi:hypothetical protein